MEPDKSLKNIQANIRRMLLQKKRASSKKSSSSQTIFIEDYIKSSIDDKPVNATKISKFLKSKLIVDKYTLENRVAFYNYIKKRLSKIEDNDCLEKIQLPQGNISYNLRDILTLDKIISSNNFGGEVYKTSVKNALGVFPIATKVMKETKDNLYEVKLMNDITNNVIHKKISKHFLIIYKYCICDKEEYSNSKKLISVNEIANGNINTLINNKDILSNIELLYNLLFQALISIATFHNLLSHIHGDCHGGNFLWHYNNEKGYYHYVFNGNNLYLKACNYNIMIYDYGMSKKIKKQNIKNLISDYAGIIPAFLNEDFENINQLSPDSNVKKDLYEILEIFSNFYKTMNVEDSKSSPKKIQKEIFNNIINEIFKKYGLNDMFITDYGEPLASNKIPQNIINKKPYHI